METKKDEKTVIDSPEWMLKSLGFRLETWGKNKGKYVGQIEFANGQNESFTFKMTPDTAGKYIALISDDVVKGASELGEKLLVSLKSQGLIKE